jgi:hypothetical protein
VVEEAIPFLVVLVVLIILVVVEFLPFLEEEVVPQFLAEEVDLLFLVA